MNLSKSELLLMRLLGRSVDGSSHLYEAYKATLMDPVDLGVALDGLISLGLIIKNEQVASLTPSGIEFLGSLFAYRATKGDDARPCHVVRTIPNEFLAPQLPVNEAYVPRWSELPKSLRMAVVNQKVLR